MKHAESRLSKSAVFPSLWWCFANSTRYLSGLVLPVSRLVSLETIILFAIEFNLFLLSPDLYREYGKI